MNLRLKGKNILITGSAKGIGRGIALAAAKEGANIALHYLHSEQEAVRTALEIKEEYGLEVYPVKGDIAKIEDVMKIKEELDHKLGGIECIVNNAGFFQMKSFFQYQPDEWKREVDVCFYGVLNLVHAFLPGMMKKKEGKFINIVGDSAQTGNRRLIISAAARNGAISFLKSLAQDVGRSNIQCNTVSIGLVNNGSSDFNEAALEKIIKQYPLKRIGKVDDVTGMVLFLLSNHADWITGQVVSVNGGYSMLG
ncbi:SDR family NAD(P)-dependent oxidoreductase [Priestia megaterium]